jgi:hypothetical protein
MYGYSDVFIPGAPTPTFPLPYVRIAEKLTYKAACDLAAATPGAKVRDHRTYKVPPMPRLKARPIPIPRAIATAKHEDGDLGNAGDLSRPRRVQRVTPSGRTVWAWQHGMPEGWRQLSDDERRWLAWHQGIVNPTPLPDSESLNRQYDAQAFNDAAMLETEPLALEMAA